MPVNTKKVTVLLFIIISLIISCTMITTVKKPKDYLVVNELQAIAIAEEYLLSQEYANQFLIDSVSTIEKENHWTVFFKHANWQNQRPSVGMISVDKISGEAIWNPLR